MTAFDLLAAFGAAGTEQIRSARALLGYEEEAMHYKHKKTARVLRAVLLIAAALAALGITAYATGVFSQHLEQPAEGETVKVRYSVVEPDGTVVEGGDLEARNIGLVISFEGRAESEVEFHANWLPEQPVAVPSGPADGYYSFLDSYAAADEHIPYQVGAHYAYPGFRYIVQGRVDIVKEETWGELEVTEFVQTQENVHLGQSFETNFVLLFHPDEGWMISVGGAESMETLEHIARELDVRQTGVEPAAPDLELMDFAALGVARG